jgi:hypothetical protein
MCCPYDRSQCFRVGSFFVHDRESQYSDHGRRRIYSGFSKMLSLLFLLFYNVAEPRSTSAAHRYKIMIIISMIPPIVVSRAFLENLAVLQLVGEPVYPPHPGIVNNYSISLLWDITPCNQLNSIWLCLLPASSWFLTCLSFQPWRWRQDVPPKRLLAVNKLQAVVSKKIEVFITTSWTTGEMRLDSWQKEKYYSPSTASRHSTYVSMV